MGTVVRPAGPNGEVPRPLRPFASSRKTQTAPLCYNEAMKATLLLLGLAALAVCGCVNQDIAARRSDIPWNQPSRAEATGALPSSLVDQYD